MVTKKFLLKFGLLLAVCFTLQSHVHAQEVNLLVSPPYVEVLVKPGKELLLPIQIENSGDRVSLLPAVKEMSKSSPDGTIIFEEIKEAAIGAEVLINGVKTSQGFVLEKGANDEVELRLSIAENAQEGDYYLYIFFETQPEPLPASFSTNIKSQIGVPLLVTVSTSGNIEAKGTIEQFKLDGGSIVKLFGNSLRIYDSSDPIPVTLSVINHGKNFIKTTGSLVIRGSFGEKALYQLQSQNILSGGKKVLHTDQTNDSSKTANLKGFFIGRYSLTAQVNLGDGAVQLSDATVFYAFPFKILSWGALGSAIGILILRRKK